jgi:hypothetical protein
MESAEKTKFMLESGYQKSEQKHCIKFANRPFENVAKFKYLGTTLTYQNYMQDEIKTRLNLGNSYYHLFLRLLSSVCCPGM